MLRYRLRTLLIVLAVGPPVIAVVWWEFSTAQWEAKFTDAGIAFATVVVLIFACLAACLVAGFFVTCVIVAINWVIAKMQGR